MAKKANTKTVTITAPKFQTAVFEIVGTAPLVIHRFSVKVAQEMLQKMETGKAASSKKNREPKDLDETFKEARYVSNEGWEGFHAGAIRAAMISACRLVNYKMTLAKLSIFVVEDGRDALQPQIPLIRIYGESKRQDDPTVTSTGVKMMTIRAAYYDWSAKVKIRWDTDQFTSDDVFNLLYRVGTQVGICEGRPDSKKSCGMGWGLFNVKGAQLI